MIKKLNKEKYYLLFLGLVCAFFFMYQLGSYYFVERIEPIFADSAREMLESSNWITPYFNYEVRFDKPILLYWLIALSYIIFGITEFAARFPSALFATALVFFTYFFARRIISKEYALISSIILATSPNMFLFARFVATDMTLTFFISATLFSGYLASISEERIKKYWWWLAYLFSGLAVLTKGPVGFVLPALIFGAYFLLTRNLKNNLKIKYVIPGLIIFLAATVPWYWAIIHEHGWAFTNFFFLKHNFSRFAAKIIGQDQQPAYYYFIAVLTGFLSWSIYAAFSFQEHISRLFNAIKEKKFNITSFKESDEKLEFRLFIILWFSIIFVFFSLSVTKFITYILPLYPALALITGNIWHEFIKNDKFKKEITISAFIFMIIFVFFAVFLNSNLKLILPLPYAYTNHILSLFFILVSLLVIFFIHKKLKFYAFLLNLIPVSTLLIIILVCIAPIYNDYSKEIVAYSQSARMNNKDLVAYGVRMTNLVFYSHKRVLYVANEDYDKLNQILANPKKVYIVIYSDDLAKLQAKFNFQLVNKGKYYSLITSK